MACAPFVYPEFWNYPPYFTLQPIKETQQKQKELWRGLILAYCRHHRVFVVAPDDASEFPPFTNPAINREARSLVQCCAPALDCSLRGRPPPRPASGPRPAGHLSRDAKLALLDDLVQRGGGEWLDGKAQRSCLVLWRTPAEWAAALYAWAVGAGLKDAVVTMDELQRGEGVGGSEMEGMHREVLLRAIKVLEGQGKAK